MEITYNNSILNDNQRKEWEDYINSQIAEYDEGLNLIFQAQKENIHLKDINPVLYSWINKLYSALKYVTIIYGDILVMHKYYLSTSNNYEKRLFRGKTHILLNEGFKKLYGFPGDKHKNKKQNTIWQDIEKILQQISPSKIHDDYTSLTNELEKLSTSFDWWKNERNLEVHLDPDKLVESRMKELNESKYMMESYEFVKLLEKAKQILYGIHTIYYNQYSCKKINM